MSGMSSKVKKKKKIPQNWSRLLGSEYSGSESKKEVNTMAWLGSQSHTKVHKMLWKKEVIQQQKHLKN